MNEIVQAVTALPADVDAKIEPLNSRLAAIGQAIESLSKLSENVEKIREEFTGFRGFRERIEGYREKGHWMGDRRFGDHRCAPPSMSGRP